MRLLSRNIEISRFYEHFKKFREICFARIFAKFKYFAKKFILTESPDHVSRMISTSIFAVFLRQHLRLETFY